MPWSQRDEQRLQQIGALLLTDDDIDTIDGEDNAAAEIARTTATAGSIVCQKAALEREKAEIVERLGKPAREYQQYLNDLKSMEGPGKGTPRRRSESCWRYAERLEMELEMVKTTYPEELRDRPAPNENVSARSLQQEAWPHAVL